MLLSAWTVYLLEPYDLLRIPINVMSMVPIMESVNILTFSL